MINIITSHLSSIPEELELLLDRVNDLIKYRIDAVLQDMTKVPLVELPKDQPLEIQDFMEKTQVYCEICYVSQF